MPTQYNLDIHVHNNRDSKNFIQQPITIRRSVIYFLVENIHHSKMAIQVNYDQILPNSGGIRAGSQPQDSLT